MKTFASSRPFADRRDAGRRLARVLRELDLGDPVILALPRGGVPVGFEIAKALCAPLDILLARKIGAPGDPEFGIGAIADGGNPNGGLPQVVLNEDALRIVQPGSDYLEKETRRQFAEIERRREIYLGGGPPIPAQGRTAIVVDDGLATGGTIRAALKALKAAGAARLILAVPVGPRSVVEALRSCADDVICLIAPEDFHAVGLYFADFAQTSDEEVARLLREARAEDFLRQDPRREQSRQDWIRARAYQIWEAEGRPEGRPEQHWLRAEQDYRRNECVDDASRAGCGVDRGGEDAK